VQAPVVLGIDVGTSGVRVAVVDEGLGLRGMSTAAMPLPPYAGGRVRQAPEVWWSATVEAVSRLDLSGLHVRALAVDGTSGTVLGVDAHGMPMGEASMYNDVAPADLCARVEAVAPRHTAALGSTSPLARALELPDTCRILHQADWIAARLSGRQHVTDENNALKSGYDPVGRTWPAWISGTGLDPTRLPDVVPAGTRLGRVLPAVARPFGLPDDVSVVAGTTDGCAAFLASGASTPGDGVTSLGTTLTIKLLSATPVFAPEFGVYSHRLADQWLAGGASNTGGAVLAHLFSRGELEELTPLLRPNVPTGLDYYPLVAPGERFPVNDPVLVPRLEPRPEDRATFLQGVLEGIAAIEARAYATLEGLGASPLTSIRSVGGGAGNPAWSHIRARVLGLPHTKVASEHAAVGVARLAWRGIGHAC
jgi:D-ribulokinase